MNRICYPDGVQLQEHQKLRQYTMCCTFRTPRFCALATKYAETKEIKVLILKLHEAN
jgi:hypothetical protein